MQNGWIPLQSVLNQGTELILDDQSIWENPIKEFGLDCKIAEPLKAILSIFQQEEGLLIRGKITGALTLPCNLCMEDAKMVIDHRFDSFEPFPAEEGEESDLEVDEYFIRHDPRGTSLEINPANLVWEEFAQALPQYPICRETCAGLCPECGQNLNIEQCGCDKEHYDPRMEKLRGLKLKK